MEIEEVKEVKFYRNSRYKKAVNNKHAVEQWLKENKAKQLTSKDNTGKVTAFNGRGKRGVKK